MKIGEALKMKEQQIAESAKAEAKLQKEVKEITTGALQGYLDTAKAFAPSEDLDLENLSLEEIFGPAVETLSGVEEVDSDDTECEEITEENVTTDFAGSVDNVDDGEDVNGNKEDKKPTAFSNANLPEIKPTDKKVILCVEGKYALYMMPLYDAESLVVENCKLYLQNLETKKLHIGAGCELKIDKSKILDSTDHKVMKIIKKFKVNFSEDDMKTAFERAKHFMELSDDMVAVSTSMNIQQAYTAVVRFAIEKAEMEKKANVMEDDRNCKHNKAEGIVSISASYLQEVLDEVEAGYTKIVFCKKLTMLEEHCGVELLISSKGRHTYNETGNRRFYKLKINKELLNSGGEQ